MKIIFACILAAFITTNSVAQTFNFLWSDSSNITIGDDRARQNAIDSSGMYIVGNDHQPGNNQWRIEKRNLYTGKIIWAKTTNPSFGQDYANDIVVFDTALYICGYENITGTDYQWRLEKRSPTTGALIWVQNSDPSNRGDVGFGVCANDSGVFMVGADYVANKNRWRMERRDLLTGNLMWAVNTNAATTGTTAQAYHVAADNSFIYVCGYDNAPGSGQWHIEKRSITTGDTIWTKEMDYSTNRYDYASDIVIDSSGIYIAGNDFSLGAADNQWNIEKRDLQTGDTLWTMKSNPSVLNDFANAITIDANYMYVTGDQGSPGSPSQWLMEKREKTNGMLICSQVSSTGMATGNAAGISVDATGVYVSGYDVAATSDMEWRMQKYSLCTAQSPPQAFFNLSDSIICEGSCITITDSSTNNPTVWNWILQGANTSNYSLQNPAPICYDSSGTYSITLLTANGSGLDSLTKIITVQNCAALPHLSIHDQLFIYPNPTHDKISIHFNDDTTKAVLLNLYDVSGKNVLQSPLDNRPVTISQLSPGIYMYTVSTPAGTLARGKLVKQ